MLTRRHLLSSVAAVGTLAIAGMATRMISVGQAEDAPAEPETFKVVHTDEEWHQILDKHQYAVLREEATEPPGSSPLLYEHRAGKFHCAGCDTAVYSSEHKYDSGTGWPSFWQPISDDVVRTKRDRLLGYPRTEVHCATCGGHFGHIFGDGPLPTRKRHCLNGLALTFVPDPKALAA